MLTRCSFIQSNARPGEKAGTSHTTARMANTSQYQRRSPLHRSSASGRHNTANAIRIGYSAIHENVNGAIKPANNPPSMPPNDSAT